MKLMRLATIILFLSVLAGCIAPKEVKVAVNGNRTVGVRNGQDLQLAFEANATTGYLWEVTEEENKGVVEQVGKSRYVHKSRRIGAGGTQLFKYETLKKGKARLAFEYKRSWEKGEPAKKYIVKVVVH